mmetsp:Transcript_26541/g.67546  ORF Transcript_26541/g.67546 Transcript_26541/m.67546 type:complete len:393 (-) Transcript_26541:771-1949(-)
MTPSTRRVSGWITTSRRTPGMASRSTTVRSESSLLHTYTRVLLLPGPGPACSVLSIAACICAMMAWPGCCPCACSSADSPPMPGGAPGGMTPGCHVLLLDAMASACPTVTSSHCSLLYALPLASAVMSARAYTSSRPRLSSTTGSADTPASSSSPSACVSGVLAVTVCSGCSLRHCRRSLESGSTSACATPASGDHVPSGSDPSGCASSGSDASEARKWRMRHASTADSVARCSTSGISLPPGSVLMMGAMEHLFWNSVPTTLARSSSGRTYTSGLGSLPSMVTSSRRPRMVCASISASLMGLPPALTLWRRRLRMLMKSLALITPLMVDASVSHSGADAMPCSCSAWNACRTGRSMSRMTTFPLSGISSYAVWLCKKSAIFLRVYSGSLGL